MMESKTRKEIAVEFLNLCSKGDSRKAFSIYVGRGFKHHNVYYKGDAETLMTAMEENARQTPGRVFDVKRALEDGEFVAVHSHVKQSPADAGAAVVHIFRFEGGKIIEAWDLGQEVPPETVNEHGMF